MKTVYDSKSQNLQSLVGRDDDVFSEEDFYGMSEMRRKSAKYSDFSPQTHANLISEQTRKLHEQKDTFLK
jgi:hypothetical protein